MEYSKKFSHNQVQLEEEPSVETTTSVICVIYLFSRLFVVLVVSCYGMHLLTHELLQFNSPKGLKRNLHREQCFCNITHSIWGHYN